MEIPTNFKVGVATAAYQIEGNAKGGAGKCHWDTFAARGGTIGKQDGSVACDHIQHWESDLDMIAAAGFDTYRFSFSWPRILPDGKLNPEGINFYDRLIDGMLDRGISPSATLYHWDLPVHLEEKGGWLNPDSANWLAELATVVAQNFGDRLDQIATINEPWCASWLSHFLGYHAPGKSDLASGVVSMHNILKAHGRAMTALRAEGAKNLGIVLNMECSQPARRTERDIRAARIQDGIYNRWFIQSIAKGSYPKEILEHFSPHMPDGWQDDMQEISQPLDWLGLNYYTRRIHADDGTDKFPFNAPVDGPLPKTAMDWEIYPEGLYYFLERIVKNYTGDLPLYVTENGMAAYDELVDGEVSDPERIDFLERHMGMALNARANGMPVEGYYAWSLMDNFEWSFGYDKRFGIVYVDYETQKRTPKASYHWLKDQLSKRAK